MALKDNYFIEKISRNTAKKLLDEYHYLHEEGNFRSGINFGLFDAQSKLLIGVIVFHTNSAKEGVKGCFAIDAYKLEGFYELGRLCMNPHRHEKNLTSFFLSGSIKLLRKIEKVVALLTYADSDHHQGYIYQATNWIYTGITSMEKIYIDKRTNEVIHPRTIVSTYGSREVDKLPEWIEISKEESGKFRYFQFLGNKKEIAQMKSKLKYEILPYPKGQNNRYDASYKPTIQTQLF